LVSKEDVILNNSKNKGYQLYLSEELNIPQNSRVGEFKNKEK
jgi:hypothetical protein